MRLFFVVAVCLGAAPIAFGSSMEFERQARMGVAAPGFEKAVAWGDMDGDGDLDMVIGYQSREWQPYVATPPYGDRTIPSRFIIKWFRNPYIPASGQTAWDEPAGNTREWETAAFDATAWQAYNRIDWLSDIKVSNIDGAAGNDIIFCTHVEGIHWIPNPSSGNISGQPVNNLSATSVRPTGTPNYYPNVRKLALASMNPGTDAILDIVAAQAETGGGANQGSVIMVYYLNSSGAVSSTGTLLSTETCHFSVSVRALELVTQSGTNYPEIVVCGIGGGINSTYYDDTVHVVYWSGSAWTSTLLTNIQINPFDSGAGNINGVGGTDLVIAGETRTVWFAGDNLGGFTGPTALNTSRVGSANPGNDEGRNDPYPVFCKVMDYDDDGDSDVFVSYFSLLSNTSGSVVYYENFFQGNFGTITTNGVPLVAATDPDTGPMNVESPVITNPLTDFGVAVPESTLTPDASAPDHYPDIMVGNKGTSTISFWNNRTYRQAPYVVSETVIDYHTIQIVFSDGMDLTTAKTAAYYTWDDTLSTGKGSLSGSPNSVTQVEASAPYKTFNLVWNTGALLQYPCSLRSATIKVDCRVLDSDGYQLRAPRQQTAFYRDEAAPTVLVKSSITKGLQAGTTGRVLPSDIDNGTYDDFTGALTLRISRSAGSGFAQYIDLTCADITTPPCLYLRATDPCTNEAISSTCTTVTVTDDVPPTAAGQNITRNVSAGNIPAALCNNGSSDACSGTTLTYGLRKAGTSDPFVTPYPIASLSQCNSVHNMQFVCYDQAGNPSSNIVAVTITLVDDVNPVAVAQNVTLTLSTTSPGTVTLTPNLINNGSSDNCAITSYKLIEGTSGEVDSLVYDCDDIVGIFGTHAVTLKVYDAAGHSATAPATVTVVDNSTPVAVGKAGQVFLNALGQATLNATALENGSTDNCALTSLVSRNSDGTGVATSLAMTCADWRSPGNEVTVYYYVRDTSNHLSAGVPCLITVTDNIAPTLVCKSTTTVLDVGSGGSIKVYPTDVITSSVENCTATLKINGADYVEYDCFTTGTYTVTVTSNDGHGNPVASCQADIEVVDNTAPTVNTKNITVNLSGSTGTVTIAEDAVDNVSEDACGIDTYDTSRTLFTCDDAEWHHGQPDAGQIPVTLTVTDINGNSASAGAIVTVKDITPPVATGKDLTVYLDANGQASITGADLNDGSTDICGASDLTFSANPNTFDCDDIAGTGQVSVLFTATDLSGNSGTDTVTVTVRDNRPPTAVCKNFTAQLGINGFVDVTPANLDNGSTDNCGTASLSFRDPDPAHPSYLRYTCDDIGSPFTVWLRVTDDTTDGTGLTADCSSQVTVVDNRPPDVVCQSITRSLADPVVLASALDNGTHDNCSADNLLQFRIKRQSDLTPVTAADVSLTLTCDDYRLNPATHKLPVYIYAIDAAVPPNMTTVGCAAEITIIDPEVPTAVCKNASLTLSTAGSVTLSPADIDNNSNVGCSNTPTLKVSKDGVNFADTLTFGCADDYRRVGGTHTVILKVYLDSNPGDFDTCEAQVRIEDVTDPTPVCNDLRSTPFNLGVDGTYTLTQANKNALGAGSSDACGITIDVTPATFTCEDLGDNTVTVTVTDGSGLSATCNNATLRIADPIRPVAVGKDITVNLGAGGSVSITGADIDGGSTDNTDDTCPLTLTASPNVFTCANRGANTVSLTVEDAAGNTDSVDVTVTVVDNEAPVAKCKAGTLQVPLNSLGQATISVASVDDGSTDNCAVQTRTVSPSTVNCASIGVVTEVTLTVTDSSGNTDTCTRAVNVYETTPPTAACTPVTIDILGGTHTLTTAEIDAISVGSSDNCAIRSKVVTPDTFDCDDLGVPQDVTLTVTDTSTPANTDTCTTTLTIISSVMGVNDPAPSPQEKYVGDSATFSTRACGGTGTYTFRWYFIPAGQIAYLPLTDGEAHPSDASTTVTITNAGAITTLSMTNLQLATEGQYQVTVNSGGIDAVCLNNGVLYVHSPVTVSAPSEVAPGPLLDMHGNTNDNFKMHVVAENGFGPYNYMWYKDLTLNGTYDAGEELAESAPFSGVATDTLTINPLALSHAGFYGCVVTDKYNPHPVNPANTRVVGAVSELTVTDRLAVTGPVPAESHILEGRDVTFTVTPFGGAGTYSFVWMLDGNELSNGALPSGTVIEDADTAAIHLTNVQLAETGTFTCRVDDASPDPAVTSSDGNLYVHPKLAIQTPPQDLTVNEGDTAYFSVTLVPNSGLPEYMYQWQWFKPGAGWQDLTDGPHLADPGTGFPGSASEVWGANSPDLFIWLSDTGINCEGLYRVRVRDNSELGEFDEVLSDTPPFAAAVLTVTNFMNVSVLPLTTRAYIGIDPVVLTAVVVNGRPPYTFRWFQNDQELAGENNALLNRGFADPSDAGLFTVEASDSSGGLNPPMLSPVPAEVRVAKELSVSDPVDVWAYAGVPATFHAEAKDGFPPYYHDWREGMLSLEAPNSQDLVLNNVSTADNGRMFHIIVSDTGSTISGAQSVESNEATLHVGTLLEFDSPVRDFSSYNDEPAFKLNTHIKDGTGFGLNFWEWKRNITGDPAQQVLVHSTNFSSNTLSLTVDPASGDGLFDYVACVTDLVKETCTEPPAKVVIAKHVSFKTPLANTTTPPGQPVELFVVVEGGIEPITYEWSFSKTGAKAWEPLPETTDTLAIANPGEDNEGTYRVVVTESPSTRGVVGPPIMSEATLKLSGAVPLAAPLGLILLTAITSLAGATVLRRRK